MVTDPFIPPAQRALTGQTSSPTAGYRALQSRYSGEGYQPVGASRTALLRTYGATTEGIPEKIDAPASAPTSPVTSGQPTGEAPSTPTTLAGGVEGGAEYEKALSYGTKNYIPVGRAAGAGFGQVEAAQYPEYWRGVINYGLPPEEVYSALKKQYGYELTDQEKGIVDPATGRPYAEAVRTIDNPNVLGMSPYEAAFLSAEGRIPKAGYVTKKNYFAPEEPAMKKVSRSTGDTVQEEYYVDTATGEKLDPSKFNFEQSLKYGTAMEGGNRPDMFEISNVFTQKNPWFQQFMPGVTGALMALAPITAGLSGASTATLGGRMGGGLALKGGMALANSLTRVPKQSGFRY